MCGIAGFWTCYDNIDFSHTLRTITDKIEHRGPDTDGYWTDTENGIALGHRRLSIIDLSPAGHQPMISQSGRYVIVYNGEVYNYQDVLKNIESYSEKSGITFKFKGTSDTEVILAAIEAFGIENAVKSFVGMFAFALFDREEKKLHLVRDRLGEKPLYYGYVNKALVFASELKPIRSFPGFPNDINRNALGLYFRHNYIPAPYSIYEGIFKLQPGTILTINNINGNLPSPVPYWSMLEVAENGMNRRYPGNEFEVITELERLLKQSIKGQMISDVPLGAFLSGGIDSSLVVSLMQDLSSRPVKTFTIGFNEKGYNEAEDAKKVAKHLGTDHTELYVSSEEAMRVIPLLPNLYDEPFSDSSQIPTFLVSKLAKQHVTVSLSGDAGDELFGGYNRYFQTQKLWNKIGWVPHGTRKVMARVAQSISPDTWDSIYYVLSLPIPKKYKLKLFGDKVHKLAAVIDSKNVKGLYDGFISHWKDFQSVVPGSFELPTGLCSADNSEYFKDQRELMMYLDTVTYLPDDILVKVDRAAMGVSLESRVPFLDHRVVEYAWRLPMNMKVRDGKGKWALRQVLYKYVPQELIDRPKMGFGVPIGEWMKGPLREWVESLLDEHRLKNEGFLNSNIIRKKWDEHLSGALNWQYHIWDVLMFEAWLDKEKAL